MSQPPQTGPSGIICALQQKLTRPPQASAETKPDAATASIRPFHSFHHHASALIAMTAINAKTDSPCPTALPDDSRPCRVQRVSKVLLSASAIKVTTAPDNR